MTTSERTRTAQRERLMAEAEAITERIASLFDDVGVVTTFDGDRVATRPAADALRGQNVGDRWQDVFQDGRYVGTFRKIENGNEDVLAYQWRWGRDSEAYVPLRAYDRRHLIVWLLGSATVCVEGSKGPVRLFSGDTYTVRSGTPFEIRAEPRSSAIFGWFSR